MKLTVLVDNNTFTDSHFYGEPGLCYFLEADNKKILFDLGFSNLYLENAGKLNIDLKKVDTIVLSHGHNDHTQGLKLFPKTKNKTKLIAHPDCLLPKYFGREYIGSPVLKNEAEKKFKTGFYKKPFFISKNIAFLGEIKKTFAFEKRKPIGEIKKNSQKTPDLLLDDTAIAVKIKKGIVAVTGCSHSGICNIINQAKKVFKTNKIYSVIGGFHLRGEDKTKLKKTAETLKKQVKGTIYPAHCTDFKAKCFLASKLKTEPVFVSKKIKF
jgi:7,8-dihydropterin-6-yl-methyl-4-(beta-D-ribofuranosyl)aminobenzene 5'-phosphate synthase